MNYLGESLVSSLGGGDIEGPASSTLNAIPRFGGTTGKTLKNSVVTISDAGRVEGVSVLETNFVQSSNSNPLTLQSQTGVELISPTSSVEVNTDVVLDASGTVSLTGHDSETAIAIHGATVLDGSLSLTGHIQMNGSSQIKGVALPTMPQDAATKQYVDNVAAVKWAQLLYNSVDNDAFSVSSQLNKNDFQPLLFLSNPPPNYFISSFNINTVDNVGFILTSTGTYKIRYRIGVSSNTPPLETNIISVVLRIDNVNRPDTEQFIYTSASVSYHDFEYIYTNSIPPVEVKLYAKIQVGSPTFSVSTSYLCFNVFKI